MTPWFLSVEVDKRPRGKNSRLSIATSDRDRVFGWPSAFIDLQPFIDLRPFIDLHASFSSTILK